MGERRNRSISNLSKPTLPAIGAGRSAAGQLAFSLNKVKLEAKLGLKDDDQDLRKSQKKRSVGAFKLKPKIPKSLIHTKTTFDYNRKKQQKNSLFSSTRPIETEDEKEAQNPPQQFSVFGKAKVSNKSIGLVEGYAVYSHPGPVQTQNENRISIVVQSPSEKGNFKQIFFFSIYQGKNGMEKADYMRDNFHTILLNDELFTKDFPQALEKAFDTIDNHFSFHTSFKVDLSAVSFIICIVIDETVYLIRSGEPKALLSMEFGRVCINPHAEEKKRAQKVWQGEKKSKFDRIDVKKYENVGKKSIDFIVLGSEGLYECLQGKNIINRVWKVALQEKQQNLHSVVGEASMQVFNDAYMQMTTKSISLIIVTLPDFASCLQDSDSVQLPFGDRKVYNC